MADTKISALTELTTAASDDELAVVDTDAAATKRITVSSLFRNLPAGSAAAPGLAFTGDTDTGLFSTGTNEIGIVTGGTERVTVSSAGRVGIGTDTPDGPLHIISASAGTITADSNADELVVEGSGDTGITILAGNASNAAINFGDDGDANIGYIDYDHNDNSLAVGVNAAEAARITSAGDVGIGIAAPDGTLHVHTATAGSVTAAGGADDLIVENSTSVGITLLCPNTVAGSINFGDPEDNNVGQIAYDHSSNSLQIIGNAAERMRVDSSGNLLIGGSTTPASSVGNLALFNGTAATDGPTNGICLFAEDVTTSSELKVVDEAANVTTLSPHNFTLYTPDPADPYPWAYYSRNKYLGKEINVDLSGAIRALEALTGQTFIHINNIPKGNWTADKQKEANENRKRHIRETKGATEQNTPPATIKDMPEWMTTRIR